jgi:hypothetical protein
VTDLESIRGDHRRLAGLPERERVDVMSWPTADFERPLSEQVDALFGGDRAPLRIGFYPLGGGWAALVVATASTSIDFGASNLSDGLRNLARLTQKLMNRAQLVQSSFDFEPRQLRFKVERSGKLVLLTLVELPDDGPGPLDRGDVRLVVTCTAREFAASVLACLDDIVARYGADGYEQLWGPPFPAEECRAIRGALEARRRP